MTRRLCAHNDKDIMLAANDENALKFKGKNLQLEDFGIMEGRTLFQDLPCSNSSLHFESHRNK